MHPTAHKRTHGHSQGSLSPHLAHTGGKHAGASLVASQGATGHVCAGRVRSDRAVSTRGCINVERVASDVTVHGEMPNSYVVHASLTSARAPQPREPPSESHGPPAASDHRAPLRRPRRPAASLLPTEPQPPTGTSVKRLQPLGDHPPLHQAAPPSVVPPASVSPYRQRLSHPVSFSRTVSATVATYCMSLTVSARVAPYGISRTASSSVRDWHATFAPYGMLKLV